MKADLSKYGKFIAAWALLLMISFMPAIAESYIIKIRPGSDAKQKLQSQFPEMINVFDNLLSDRIKINRDSPLSAVQNRALDKLSGYYIIETVPGRSIQDIISEITSTDGVISIEPNYLYHTEQIGLAPNDSAYKYQWGLGAINIEEAWQRASGDGVLVGVVDTGIDWEHPDLKNNLYINPQEDINGNGRFDPWSSSESRDGVAGDLNGIDDDGNGYPDDVIGYDFVNQDVRNLGDASGRDPLPADEHSHGTIVSGVIAAERNNKIGIAGIAYNSKILTARGLDANGAGEADDIAQAIVYCALQGADVINFSFGEPYVSSIMQDAIDFAASMGCVMVSSSGNNGWDRRHFPSDHDNVISVGAVNSDGLRDWRSNYGSHLDLTAPGVNIITTNLGGGYRPATGTSLAAPHVSGAAALLLQNNPDFTPQEVRGLLRASARDAGENGWDQYFASGILDAAKLLEFRGITEIVIDYPKNEDEFSRDLSTEIPIIGTIATPLLDKIEIYIGEGINPRPASDKLDPWSFINEGFTVKNDTIAKISTAGLRDTVYTVRVLAYLKNNNTIEERINIYLYSDNSSNEFVSFRQFEALNREKRLPAVAAATSMRSQLSIMYRPENSTDEYHSASEKEFMTRNHLLLLDRAEPGIAYEAIAVARLQNGDTISRSFTFALPDEKVVTGQFARKDYSLPPGYLCPQVADLYQPGQPVIALNELTNYFWNNIKTFEFADGDFTEKDESYESWIPAGMGESNGDGIPEILAFTDAMTRLYQSTNPGGNPFESIIFADQIYRNFWAATMYDLTGDGLDEIIAYSDTSFIAYTFAQGAYQPLAIATSEGKFKYIGTFPGHAIGDFDGDGNIELCHGSSRGYLYIYEYKNGNFSREFIDSNGVDFTNQFLASADVDGDGSPEIFSAIYGSDLLFKNYPDDSKAMWRLRLLKSKGPNQYEYVWEDFIWGGRTGVGYRNGFSAGDIDADGTDEIIAATFPDLYIFKWDDSQKRLKTIWRYPNSFSNAAVVYDFDKNGINEFGFSTGFDTYFYEFEKDYEGPGRPTGIEGYATDATTALIHWEASPDAEEYEVYSVDFSGPQPTVTLLGDTDTTEFTAPNLAPNDYHNFTVRAVNNSLNPAASNFSNVIEIYTHDPIRPAAATASGHREIIVSYDGKLANLSIPSLKFRLEPRAGFAIYPRSAIPSTDTSVTLVFSGEIADGSYTLHAGIFPDFYDSPTIAGELDVNVEFPDEPKELYLKQLITNIPQNNIRIIYSEPVDPAGAQTPSNYDLQPIGEIISATVASDNSSAVDLSISGFVGTLARGRNYTITVSNVNSASGRGITTGPGNTLGFVFSPERPDPYVYPHPIKFDKMDNIYFANIPNQSKVYIMKINGELLRTLTETDGNGGVEWNGKDNRGARLEPGVYLYKVESPSDGRFVTTDLKKIMIIP